MGPWLQFGINSLAKFILMLWHIGTRTAKLEGMTDKRSRGQACQYAVRVRRRDRHLLLEQRDFSLESFLKTSIKLDVNGLIVYSVTDGRSLKHC